MERRTDNVKVKGVVNSGMALGRRLGYPTANVYGVEKVPARDGVYAVKAVVEGIDRTLYGMANLGRRPTVDTEGAGKVLEVHFFDFAGDLYKRKIEVELCSYIRPEMAFPGIEQLEEQLRTDEAVIRRFFENN